MKTIFVVCGLLVFGSAQAQISPAFIHAINMVETGGRSGQIWGDHHKAYGGLQIHKNCWKDSQIKGKYSDCSDLNYSSLVLNAYCLKYEHHAVQIKDYETLARLWNGGCGWRLHPRLTDVYWGKVKRFLKNSS